MCLLSTRYDKLEQFAIFNKSIWYILSVYTGLNVFPETIAKQTTGFVVNGFVLMEDCYFIYKM